MANERAKIATGRTRAAIAFAAACLIAAAAAIAWPGGAGSAPLRIVVLGKTSDPPRPTERQATGRVTGFQSLSAGTIKPFKAPYAGKIISWSITLSKVRKADGAFFDDLFGSPAEARIGVLKEVPDAHPKTFKLVRQGPTETLNPYFGQTVHFALDHPLTVLEDQVVALTIPTWAPTLAVDIGSDTAWRASRLPDKCGETPDQARVELPAGHPQQKVKSKKVYACYYRGSRLLYTATLVKKPS